LIVDEAQDILVSQYLDLLEFSIPNGLDGGRWRFFADFENQAIFNSGVALEPVAAMKEHVPAGRDAGRLYQNRRHVEPHWLIVENRASESGQILHLQVGGGISDEREAGRVGFGETIERERADILLNCRLDAVAGLAGPRRYETTQSVGSLAGNRWLAQAPARQEDERDGRYERKLYYPIVRV
jgi:hypothetical protein